MRSHVFKRVAIAYTAVSLAAIVWLSMATVSAQALHDRALASQTSLLTNTLQGTIQNLEAAAASNGASSEEVDRLLVNGMASLAQVEILALGYEKSTDRQLPVRDLAGFYLLQVRLIREDTARTNTLTPVHRATLKAVAADLALIKTICQPDLLIHENQEAITALFANTADALSTPGANLVLLQNNPK